MAKKKDMPANVDLLAAKHDVTDAGCRLLEVMSRPETRLMTVTERCELAGISRDWYYQLLKDPRFQAAYKELCDITVTAGVIGSIQTIEQAAMHDPQAAIELLKLSGYYQPTARVEHTHTHEAGKSLLDMYKARKAVE